MVDQHTSHLATGQVHASSFSIITLPASALQSIVIHNIDSEYSITKLTVWFSRQIAEFLFWSSESIHIASKLLVKVADSPNWKTHKQAQLDTKARHPSLVYGRSVLDSAGGICLERLFQFGCSQKSITSIYN